MRAVSKKSLVAACVLAIVVCGARRQAAAQKAAAAELPGGVKAVWGLEEAYRESTKTRERVCVNGLWRWQPAREDSDAVPESGWGYFKVPGCWPGISDYMQKDCQTVYAHPSWKDEDLGGIAAAWQQREITVPREWTGRRIVLHAEYVNSFAAVYIDGKKAGEIRFPSGEADLTRVCRPGGKHVLSIHVVAMPLEGVMLSYNDTASAKKVRGRVARRGLCGDVYLASTPPGPRINDVKAATSVRNWSIRFDAALDDLAGDSKYVLQAGVTDGPQTIRRFASRPFGRDELKDGRIAFAETWRPEKLWDVHTPQNMYGLHLSLWKAGGELLDESLPVRFGFREFWIDGRDFILNGARIFLSAVPLDNAQVGAAWANYEAARESLRRLGSFGINFVYTHNYGCQPGDHLSFEEILRAADDAGMLVALSQPHFGHYQWDSPDADKANGYARHAAFYVRVAQNHPSVVAYATSHNATGYAEDMNPDMIDGIQARRDQWSARNVTRALRAEAMINSLDPSRFVYHHSSGNLGPMHTMNFYANFVPNQEMSDWFEHWSKKGVKPVFTCEYTVPMSWDWTMYRGWYQGRREFGSAVVPWEYCVAEWNAQFYGDRAYRISQQEKENLRWEAEQYRAAGQWHRWDYPNEVGSSDFREMYPIYAMYFADNWPAFRTWEVSANSPWEHGHYWRLRDGVDKGRKEFKTDWRGLQRPGLSPDYTEDRYERMDLAFELSDWIPTEAARELIRTNRPLLGYIAGKPAAFTSKDHNFYAGEAVEKQLILINNSRENVKCACQWSLGPSEAFAGGAEVAVGVGQQRRIPLRFQLPDQLAPGLCELKAAFRFSTGETQEDSFSVHVLPRPAAPRANTKIALFDPKGQTTKWLDTMGIRPPNVGADADLSRYEMLIVGKNALTVRGPAPDVMRVRDGLKVLLFEQTPEVLEQRFGFRVATYGFRWVFKRTPDHPILAGVDEAHLRNWRGEAATVPPRLEYRISTEFGAPTVRWCGIPVTRLWRCGNRGNVASVSIEKPARGDFLPILDAGYSLQYSPLMECREGKGMVLFCQMDVTGRTENDPAAETLARSTVDYVSTWKPRPRRKALYVGDPAGKSHLESAGVSPSPYHGGRLGDDEVLVVGAGAGRELAGHAAAVADWLQRGGRLLAVGLGEQEADAMLPLKVKMTSAEHIAAYFKPSGMDSLLAGVCPADVHNPAPRELPLVSGGDALPIGNGVLGAAKEANVVFCQLAPYTVSKSRGAAPFFGLSEQDAAEGKQSALLFMGGAPWAQFGQKVQAGQVGKTYTFAALVKALGGPVRARLEVERAGRPWDRAVRGEDVQFGENEWTELHATFQVDKPYPEGWTAYLHCSEEGARLQADLFQLYEGSYVPGRAAARGAPTPTAASRPNLFANPGFESGTDPWRFSYRTTQHNLKRTYRRTSCLLTRLLANMGVAGSTPLLERFSTPVGGAAEASAVRNGTFSRDADGDGKPDEWTFSSDAKGASCTRQRAPEGAEGWAVSLTCPPAEGGKKPSVMLAQYDVPANKGQWYRISFLARAEELASGHVTVTLTNMANWRSLFPYEPFTPGAKWERFSFEVQSNDTVEQRTRFQIWYDGPGKLWLSDVRLTPMSDPTQGRWLEGLYLDAPEEWDDPYRFFRW